MPAAMFVATHSTKERSGLCVRYGGRELEEEEEVEEAEEAELRAALLRLAALRRRRFLM